jgi:osmotically-inducible protein OsmY
MKSGRRGKYAGLALMCALSGLFSVAGAQAAAPLIDSRSTTSVATGPQGAESADQELQQRVAAALHSSRYIDDRHIDVSADGGAVVLSGFVLNEWDLLDALSAARKAAGGRPVIDELSIKLGGR